MNNSDWIGLAPIFKGVSVKIDQERVNDCGSTGIFVRAQDESGKWHSVDILQITKESLLEWLKSGGGDNKLAENTIGILFGHGHLHE